jgi:hypothetical protein
MNIETLDFIYKASVAIMFILVVYGVSISSKEK